MGIGSWRVFFNDDKGFSLANVKIGKKLKKLQSYEERVLKYK